MAINGSGSPTLESEKEEEIKAGLSSPEQTFVAGASEAEALILEENPAKGGSFS